MTLLCFPSAIYIPVALISQEQGSAGTHTGDVSASPGNSSSGCCYSWAAATRDHSLVRAGFVRLAMQQNANLVPVLCLGELSALRNFVDLPGMQVRASCRHMRLPLSQPLPQNAPVLAWPPAHCACLLKGCESTACPLEPGRPCENQVRCCRGCKGVKPAA